MDLAFLLIDLFFAGSETTTSTLTWLLYYLATHPRVQDKLQAEIDLVLPEGQQATLDDKPRLPYTEAVFHETLRKSALLPIGLQHVAEKDTTVGGHFIPKGAVLNGAIFTIHHDTRYWDNPDEFLPERWLNDEGKFVTKKEGFLAFGIGKRQCLGESLARMELLVFTTTLLQRLSFASPQGKTLNLHQDTQNPFVHLPLVQDILVSVRA
ncbi:Cytochrome P450 2L1 [Chionoecetes opilio]|uniref:Cytochrome P450 2L1 n=1 Tax=Chionoecetes opilio TaxID=41210 RepID=A0A8J8WNK6_CHIOP|nr:Cytochrome P450 2L1 [Chionoecetes opilio]